MAVHTRAGLQRSVNWFNLMMGHKEGSDGFIEIESNNPGDGRKYRFTSHGGSTDVSPMMTVRNAQYFIDGMTQGAKCITAGS